MPTRRPRNRRLQDDEWIETALDMLAEGGVEAVRIEPLAKRLGVTKGSFYPRYSNRDALLVAVLDYWRRVSTVDVLDVMAAIDESPRDRLQRLLNFPKRRPDTRDRVRLEMGIRLWATSDPRAEATMREIDDVRRRYIASVLRANDVPEGEIDGRVALIFSYIVIAGAMPEMFSANATAFVHRLLSRDTVSGA